jgi:hypothetical protein
MTNQPRLTTLRSRVPASAQRLTPRPKEVDAFYVSKEWRELVREIIRHRGRRCEAPSCETPRRGLGQRIYADHRHEIRDGGAPLDPNNIQLLCARRVMGARLPAEEW